MQETSVARCQAMLSAVVVQARQGETSTITRHGRPEAVIVSFEEWQRLSQVPSFGRLLAEAQLDSEDVRQRHGSLRENDL